MIVPAISKLGGGVNERNQFTTNRARNIMSSSAANYDPKNNPNRMF